MSIPDHLDVCDEVLALVGDRAEAQVVVSAGRSSLTRFANSGIHQNVAEDAVHVGLRVSLDGKLSSAGTSATDHESLGRLVDRALDAAALRPVDTDWPGLAPAAAAPDLSAGFDAATHDATPEQRAAVVRAFVDGAPELRAAGYCDTDSSVVSFANTAGQRLVGRSTRSTIDGIHQSDTSAGSAHQTSTRLADIDGVAAGERAALKARSSIDAVDIEPGVYPVLLEPEAVATILVFLAAYGFNAKAHAEGRSFAHPGEQQFDPSISIWDDALDARGIPFPFDVEGTPKSRLDLVAGGKTVGLTHDRRTAAKAGVESTGHGVPGGESFGGYAQNAFLGGGSASHDELVTAVDRGLLITCFNYCRILDEKTQVVTGLTRNGTFLVENGKIAGAVRNLRFTQSFVGALGPGKVLAVGNDGRLADSEFGPGGCWAPSLALAGWNFTGGAKG
ncbi:MAG TPA: TldD/PmbA family protein [Acidimicrobiales bacterium]|nr:TldD/PmbA family protein [Acidimicrobiales bacterium]